MYRKKSILPLALKTLIGPLFIVTMTNSPSSYRIGKAASPSFKVYPDTIYHWAGFRDISKI
ncbi:hypothetical protein Mapa_005935 [Marchantia paleacea]|nr:hypothetical protein Mapa_005935 [Marchantia paleacea]